MLNFTLQGHDRLKQALGAQKERLEDLRPFHTAVTKPELLRAFADIIAAQGKPSWAALAVATIEEKQKHGYPLDILVRKGRLRKSYTQEGGENRITITRDSLTFESLVPYAVYHEQGRGVPQRQIAGQVLRNKEFLRRINRKTISYINTGRLK